MYICKPGVSVSKSRALAFLGRWKDLEHQAPFHTGKISSGASAAHSGHRQRWSRPGAVTRWERGQDQGSHSLLGWTGGQAPRGGWRCCGREEGRSETGTGRRQRPGSRHGLARAWGGSRDPQLPSSGGRRASLRFLGCPGNGTPGLRTKGGSASLPSRTASPSTAPAGSPLAAASSREGVVRLRRSRQMGG